MLAKEKSKARKSSKHAGSHLRGSKSKPVLAQFPSFPLSLTFWLKIFAFFITMFGVSMVGLLIFLGYQQGKQGLTTTTDPGFTAVKDLRIGDRVYVDVGKILQPDKIVSIDKFFSPQQVYNLKVKNEPRTYLANDFAVHNKGGSGDATCIEGPTVVADCPVSQDASLNGLWGQYFACNNSEGDSDITAKNRNANCMNNPSNNDGLLRLERVDKTIDFNFLGDVAGSRCSNGVSGCPVTFSDPNVVNKGRHLIYPSVGTGEQKGAVKWTGMVKIDQPGNWTFYLYAGAAGRLYIDGNKIIDTNGEWARDAGPNGVSGTIGLTQDWHTIVIDAYRGFGEFILSYSGPSQAKIVVPTDHLRVGGLWSQYYDNNFNQSGAGDPSLLRYQRLNSQIDFRPLNRNGSPAGVVESSLDGGGTTTSATSGLCWGSWSSKNTGYVTIPGTPGITPPAPWTFYVNSNEMFKLWFDKNGDKTLDTVNELVISKMSQAATVVELSYTQTLSPGNYVIRLDQIDKSTAQPTVLQLSFSGPGVGKQIIPWTNLIPTNEVTGTGTCIPPLPIGSHDNYFGPQVVSTCMVRGWTCDLKAPNQALNVNIYADNVLISPLTGLLANNSGEPAIGAACGGSSDHRFSFPVPPSYQNGVEHTYRVDAVGTDGKITTLPDRITPSTMTCYSPPTCSFTVKAVTGSFSTFNSGPTSPYPSASGISPLPVTITNASLNATSYAWSIDDITIPKNIYLYSGKDIGTYYLYNSLPGNHTFQIILNVTNGIGESRSCGAQVVVSPGQDAWFQAPQGSVHLENPSGNAFALNTKLPTGKTFGTAATGFTVSQGGWSTAPGSLGAGIQAAAGSFNGEKENYDYWSKQLDGKTAPLPAGNEPSLPASGLYLSALPAPQSLNLGVGNTWKNIATKVVILANEDVNITENITVANGGALMVVTSGNLTIASNVANVEGVYIANNITTQSQCSNNLDLCVITPDLQLQLKGSFIAWNSVSLNRNLGSSGNILTPAEVFTYRPDIVANLRKFKLLSAAQTGTTDQPGYDANDPNANPLFDFSSIWQEVAP